MEIFTDECIGETVSGDDRFCTFLEGDNGNSFTLKCITKKNKLFFEFEIAGTGFWRLTTIFEKFENNEHL